MNFDLVVSILQVGLSGFSFLLAYLAYQIIAKEQKKKEPKKIILKSARTYFLLCLMLALIVGGFRIVEIGIKQKGIDIEEIANCRDNLELLRSRAERFDDSESLKTAIIEYESGCSELLRKLENVYE